MRAANGLANTRKREGRMTLRQLKYLIEVAKLGSFNAAAQQLYVSQSTLSMAIRDLEVELGIEIFTRTNKGILLTSDGAELVGYAQQVLDQATLLESRYTKTTQEASHLAISTQHYAFCVQAFISLIDEYDADAYTFTLRETRTEEIIRDLREFRSDIGVLYLSSQNERVVGKALQEASLEFVELFEASVHVFVGPSHPLAHKSSIKLSDLEDYPRYSFEQGLANSFYFAEEPFGALPHKRNVTFSDRGTLTNLLTFGSGYTLSTGVLSNEMQSGIVAIPLDSSETMRVGYVIHAQRKPSALMLRYIELLRACIADSDLVTIPS